MVSTVHYDEAVQILEQALALLPNILHGPRYSYLYASIHKGEIEVNTGFVVLIQRYLFVVLIAAALAFAAIVTPMLMEQVSSLQLTQSVSACSASGGGC